MPLDEVLRIAKQIADALEAAHEKGITHRDLKPGNINIKPDGTVKVLDFGLAKMGGGPTAHSDNSPTMTIGATQAGIILGTAAYMAPEQARGKDVDRRADIWAFGVVVYEMVTGQKLFKGEDLSETLASVIKEEPKLGQVPQKVQRLLRSCLEKDPNQRLQAIGDWRLLLDDSHPQFAAPSRNSPWARLAWVCAGIAALAGSSLAFIHFREQAPAAEVIRFQVPPPAKTSFDIYLALAPDGRRLPFTAAGSDGLVRVWVRAVDTVEAKPLNGTEGAGSL